MIKKADVAGFLAFFKFPKPFIYDDKYKTLDNNAKLLYMLLFSRLELSVKNGWHDKDGNVFQYYTNPQLGADLNASEKTVVKWKKMLQDVGLLKEVRQGQGLPNRLYIRLVDSDAISPVSDVEMASFRTVNTTATELEDLQSGTVKSTVLELEKLQPNETENNETENNNNTNVSSDDDKAVCEEVIAYLNASTQSDFRAKSKSTQRLIRARLKEGYKLEDFKHVIDVKCAEWAHDSRMASYLRPKTLFGTKFESYLNQKLPGHLQKEHKIDERLGF